MKEKTGKRKRKAETGERLVSGFIPSTLNHRLSTSFLG
jgi:hypothetical protein